MKRTSSLLPAYVLLSAKRMLVEGSTRPRERLIACFFQFTCGWGRIFNVIYASIVRRTVLDCKTEKVESNSFMFLVWSIFFLSPFKLM